MPRFYFDVEAEQPDSDGVELRDRDHARSEAIRVAGEILRDVDGHLRGDNWVMRVRDDLGGVLEVRFSITEPKS